MNKSKILDKLKLLDDLDNLDDEFSLNNTFESFSTIPSSKSKRKQWKVERKSSNQRNRPINVRLIKKYIKDQQNPFEHFSCDAFVLNYGFRKETVRDIYQMIEYGFISNGTQRGKPKPPIFLLLITLQFLTTGSIKNMPMFKISQSTVSRTLKKVTGLISALRTRFIRIPDANSLKEVAEQFHKNGGFPDVLACIGSTHIAIKTPVKSIRDDYLNENGFYSYRLFACTGPNMEFFEIISRWPGASHENKIFNLSDSFQRFQFSAKLNGVFLANRRYSCTDLVMTPFDIPVIHSDSNNKHLKYNAAHEKTYNFFDAINLLRHRFRCLKNALSFNDGKMPNDFPISTK